MISFLLPLFWLASAEAFVLPGQCIAEGNCRDPASRPLAMQAPRLKRTSLIQMPFDRIEKAWAEEDVRQEQQLLATAVAETKKAPEVQASKGEVGSALVASEARIRSIATATPDAIAVVIIVCKRPQYLRKAMGSILKAKRDPEKMPIIISQDDFDGPMTQMVESTYVVPGIAHHMHHTHDPSAQAVAKKFGGSKATLGYVRIAQHFGWVMKQVFDDFGFKQILLLEEDMEISPDFFSYFGAMLPILRSDPDLFCVSAWNDNGYESLVSDPKEAFRTDFFPGLGWMMHINFWNEVRDRWAEAYWDEFMRRGDVRKNRHCIRPDISRSFTFGEAGTSGGQFFKQHLSKIKMNQIQVDWATEDVRHLESAAAYDGHLMRKLREATKASLESLDTSLRGATSSAASYRIEYDDSRDYKKIAKKFGIMPDEKEGIRRMSYRGVIPFAWQGKRLYLHTRKWPGDLS